MDSGHELPFPSHPATSVNNSQEKMAEAKHSVPFNPFDAEVLMLLRAEAEMTQERWKARLAKDVKVEPENVTKPLVTKPVWPYEMWLVNYLDSPSEFNRQTRHGVPFSCTSENNQPDHTSSLNATTDSCESRLFREAADKESMPHMEATAAAEPLAMEVMTDFLQRSINMLSDLQDLLSLSVEKYSPTSDSGRNETDSTSAEETQRILQEMDENSKRDTVVEENLHLPYTDDKSTPFDFDVGLKKSLEKVTPVSQNKVYIEENIEKESKEPIMKSIQKSAECEVLRPRALETGPSCESDHAVSTVFEAFGLKEDATYTSTMVRAQETMETKSDKKRTGTVKCKESQTKIEESEEDMGVMNMDKAPKQVEEISTSKVHHFKTELQSAVSAQSVLDKTIREWLPSVSIDRLVKTEHIKQLVRSLMNNVVSELQTKHCLFSKCYIIETGSMAEGTKIGQPDEFDFTIALPMLADSDVAELLYIKLGIQTRLHNNIRDEVLSFLGQFSFVDSSYRHYLTNAYLLQVFRETLKKHLPLEWTMREESGLHMMRVYLKNQTLTLHLQCESRLDAGFILSIDVCFGIPLNTERLQTIYIADHTHALHLSFIQSQCLRMNTGVVGVISRNPLVAERFFFQTEPYKFHGNKSAADCYKLAKHVARSFLPKINKNNCSLCEDTLIPSFYMKTVAWFMMDFYTEAGDWSETQLGNRLIEIFEIISYSFQHEFKALAYNTHINSMKLDFKMKYSPTNGNVKAGIGMDNEKPCTIPRMEDLNLASSHEEVSTAVKSYWKYMTCEEWAVGDLLHKLIELLYVLKFTKTDCNQLSVNRE